MQAVLFFAMFGALMAAVAGLVSTSVESTQQFVQNQVTQTRTYFGSAQKVWFEQIVPQNMQIPYQTCPDGNNYGADDVRSYLCQVDIARLAQWSGSNYGIADPWKTEFAGYVLKKETVIYAAPPSYVVSVPVTAMVLVSAGPDRKFGNQLQLDLTALSSASSIRDVLRVSAPDPTTCVAATAGSCDDIVVAFTDKEAQERRWKAVQAAVGRIAAAAQRHYDQQYRAFQTQLPSIVQSNIASFFDAGGNLVLNESNVNLWQGQGINPPTFNRLNLNLATERVGVGVDEEFQYITDNIAAGGSSLNISFAVTSSTNGYEDILTISLTNNNSPWGRWESGGGALGYQEVVQATQTD